MQSTKKVVPKEYWALLDDRGELRIAMAFSRHAAGGFFVVGGSAENVLGKWLEQTKKATGTQSTKDSRGQEGAAADIIVHIDKTGASDLLAVVNDEDGWAARACFAAVDGDWTVPRISGRPVDDCRVFRCAF